MAGVPTIDLNADLGERYPSWRSGDDEAILEVVTTAHIACGFHSGDPTVMFETIETAMRLGVSIGAHPSYPDRESFGRRPIDIDPKRIWADVVYQIGALDAIARSVGTRVRSVKAHGALYNRMAVDGECATAVATATRDFGQDLWLVVPAGSHAVEAARSCGVRVAEEAFCDRAYRADATLAPRTDERALVTDPTEAADRAVRLCRDHVVETVDGTTLQLNPSTLCVHGDTPGAAALARTVRRRLEASGVELVAFGAG